MRRTRPQPSGALIEWMLLITAVSSLLVFFQPFQVPFGWTWSRIHLALGLGLIASMFVHFFAKRRACSRNN